MCVCTIIRDAAVKGVWDQGTKKTRKTLETKQKVSAERMIFSRRGGQKGVKQMAAFHSERKAKWSLFSDPHKEEYNVCLLMNTLGYLAAAQKTPALLLLVLSCTLCIKVWSRNCLLLRIDMHTYSLSIFTLKDPGGGVGGGGEGITTFFFLAKVYMCHVVST